MAYSDKVLDHYSNPRNVGSLDKAAGNVGTGVVGAPECGPTCAGSPCGPAKECPSPGRLNLGACRIGGE